MSDQDPRTIVATTHRQAVMIVGALLLGVLTFTAVAVAVQVTEMFEASSPGPMFRWVFVGIAAVILGIARPLERHLAAAADRQADARAVASTWLTSRIVGSGLREAVGMLGGVLTLLGDLPAGLALAGASVGVMLLAFPLRSDLEERVRRAGR